jgi:hypothetical protein
MLPRLYPPLSLSDLLDSLSFLSWIAEPFVFKEHIILIKFSLSPNEIPQRL